jgi:acyl dehydratase
MSTTAGDAATVGQELPALVKPISQRQIDAYSGVRPRSIHTDADWARRKGFATTLAQGMMSTAYVSEMLTGLLGEGFVVGGEMSVVFIEPVLAGDTLTAHGVVKEKVPEGDRVRVVVEVWCENQHGRRTMVGTASGLAPSDRAPSDAAPSDRAPRPSPPPTT